MTDEEREHVHIIGQCMASECRELIRAGDSKGHDVDVFNFCPECGATIADCCDTEYSTREVE